jgi:hypothetical protein
VNLNIVHINIVHLNVVHLNTAHLNIVHCNNVHLNIVRLNIVQLNIVQLNIVQLPAIYTQKQVHHQKLHQLLNIKILLQVSAPTHNHLQKYTALLYSITNRLLFV